MCCTNWSYEAIYSDLGPSKNDTKHRPIYMYWYFFSQNAAVDSNRLSA